MESVVGQSPRGVSGGGAIRLCVGAGSGGLMAQRQDAVQGLRAQARAREEGGAGRSQMKVGAAAPRVRPLRVR